MDKHIQAIEGLLEKRDIRKAEIAIAKQLRGNLTEVQRAQVMICRARARLLSARPDDAIDDLQVARTALSDAFETPANLELLADCYLMRYELASVGFAERNDATQARNLYQQIIDTHPNYENAGWVFYQLGRVLLTDNQVERAIASFQEALLRPSHESALTAYCYERLGFVAFYEERNLDRALGFLNKAIDTYTSPDRVWLVQVHIVRSHVLRDMYQYDKALQAAETAVQIAFSAKGDNRLAHSEALFTLAELLSKVDGREKDVVTHLQQFLQINKKPVGVDVTWSRVHDMLGDAYFRLGQYDQAATAYLAALEFNPYHPWEASIYYRIARSYYQKNNYDKAIEAIQKILEAAEAEGQSVDDYRVYDVLGNAHFALANYPKAIEAYQKALDLAPPNAENIEKIKTYHQYALELNQSL